MSREISPLRLGPIKGNVKRNISPSARSYKRECQEKYLPFGSVPTLFLSRHSAQLVWTCTLESRVVLLRPSPLISFRRLKRRNVSSSLWFHTLVATAPFVSETSSLTVIHFMSGNAWSYLRLVAYGFLGLSERA